MSTAKSPDVRTGPATWWTRFQPVRFRYGGAGPYTREHWQAMARRWPWWLALVIGFSWEETSPFTLLHIQGPSMIPTMAPDGSDIWLRRTYTWRRKLGWDVPYRRNDLVGFAHPDQPQHVSCKRIVGLAGDRVQRYGQYVHLYVPLDPHGFGMTWPPVEDSSHAWMDRSCPWDTATARLPDVWREARRTVVVPPGHVWVEADCPNFGIDSRHFGPIPVEWLQGKISARVWPLWRAHVAKEEAPGGGHGQRPHPISLDDDTLRMYNVHKKMSSQPKIVGEDEAPDTDAPST